MENHHFYCMAGIAGPQQKPHLYNLRMSLPWHESSQSPCKVMSGGIYGQLLLVWEQEEDIWNAVQIS